MHKKSLLRFQQNLIYDSHIDTLRWFSSDFLWHWPRVIVELSETMLKWRVGRHISWSRDCLRSAAMETRLEGLARWCVRDCLRSAAMETRLEGLARWCVCCYQRAGGVSGAGLVRRVSLCGDKTFTSRLVSPAAVDQVVTGWSLSADTHTHTHTHTHTSRSVCVSDKVSHTVHYLHWRVWAVHSTSLSVQSNHGGSAFARLIFSLLYSLN